MTAANLLDLIDHAGPTDRQAGEALCGLYDELSFGAYKGRCFFDVNLSYLLWLGNTCKSISHKQRRTIKALIEQKQQLAKRGLR